MSYCYKCGMQLEPNDSFCSKCGAQVRMTKTNFPNNPYAAPKYCKTCPKCRSYVQSVLQRCPYCNFEFVSPHRYAEADMSVKKFLGLLALALAVIGLFRGIIIKVAALVTGIVSLCIRETKEKHTKIFAILAIILSACELALIIIWRILWTYERDHLMDEFTEYLIKLISKLI